MKRTLSVLAAALMLAGQAFGQTFDFSLKNGNKMQVQACSDRIFRVRITPDENFPESLLERYRLIKTDWTYDSAKLGGNSRTATVSTGRCRLVVDKKDGSITLAGADGRTIVDRISFIEADNSLVADMGAALNERFKGYNKAGGIIGDPGNETRLTADIDDAGNLDENSIISLTLKEGERLYGGGNTSREHIQHRGEILRMWATYQKTEIPIPFMLSSNGWAVFNNTTVRNYFDMGVTDPDMMYIYNTTSSADFYLFAGDSMREAINLYTSVTGKTYVLPKWAYGLAFGPNMLENMFEFVDDALTFREEKVPCDLFWIEPQWMEKYYDFSTQKNWNYKLFPGEPYWVAKNPNKTEHRTQFIARMHKLGYKIALWLCIDFDESLPEEDALAAAAGKPQSGQEHWFDHLTKFMDQGVDGFKLDPGRTLDEHPDRDYYNGRKDTEMHNLNQVLMPKQMNQTFRNHTGKRSFHHYCAGYAGTQHWSASQSGDNGGGRTALFDQLNLNFSGYMNTSCDVMSHQDEMAALHMGVLLPWVQINSWFGLLHPWYLPEKEKNMYRDYIQLRYDLIPYIYSSALKCAQFGDPMLQAMPYAFPDDRNVDDMVYQYMFGESLLVGVFSDSIYLPEGDWINYWTGERVHGKARTEKFDIPDNRAGLLFIKDGAIIPYQKGIQFISCEAPDTLTLRIYPHGTSSYTMYEDDGITYGFEDGRIAGTRFDCVQDGTRISFTINPVEGNFEGMCRSRTYLTEFFCGNRPEAVYVDGRLDKGWTYDKGCLSLAVSQVDVAKKVEVKVVTGDGKTSANEWKTPVNDRIAIFGEHIESIASQQKITFREAAQKVYDMGYRGVDVCNTISPENMKILDEIGFEHAAVHAHILFSDGDQSKAVEQTIRFMVENHFDKILLVPGFLSEHPTDKEWETIIGCSADFARKAGAAGIDVMLEDYDRQDSPTYNTARLEKMFESLPDFHFVFDSGNFAFAGEAVLVALDHFLPRTRHVHLKDRLAYGNASLPATAVGGGILPVGEIVAKLKASGYDGWFTVEHFGSKRMLEDAGFSIRTLQR